MIEKIQEVLLQQRPIRLARTLRDRGEETLEQFIRNFLTDYNENRETIYVDDGEEQCDTGRRRSIDDIFLICHYYYACSLADVARILYITLPDEMDEYRSSYCGTIRKRVFYWDGSPAMIYNKRHRDQFQMTWYDWREQLGVERGDEPHTIPRPSEEEYLEFRRRILRRQQELMRG